MDVETQFKNLNTGSVILVFETRGEEEQELHPVDVST